MAIPPENGKTVLVTGFNGYIAGVLVQLLLKNGYTIRGTTRRAASAEPLLEGPFAEYKDRIVIYEVPDMTASGAFDECSKGEQTPISNCRSRMKCLITSRRRRNLPHGVAVELHTYGL